MTINDQHITGLGRVTMSAQGQRFWIKAGYTKFINMKMKLDDFQKVAELIASRISRVKGIHFELEVVGVEVTNEDIILVLMSGLLTAYNQSFIALDVVCLENITLKNVIAQLTNEEGWWD